jgi:hypothetical protein
MASANPLPLEQPAEPLDFHADVPGAEVLANPAEESPSSLGMPQPVSPNELNAWRRGFTPQAEIWNGRLAMLGLSVGLTVLLVARLVATRAS